jgi:(1->4)-alpha-D-glucan 1-alpha-D-glucosylmutase
MSERRKVSATYRMQFTREFTFADAEALVPYLHRLGISHLYASPVFEARPGSSSGYDTCDFSRIGTELGGEPAFNSMVNALHEKGMGLIVDFVPNHMSAHPQWNLWWRNVLANGPSSPVSEYFDIDWYPVNSNLHGKVLLAILGQQYGDVLESGELRVEYRDGEFCLLYNDFNLPLNPRQMKFLLRHRWEGSENHAGIEAAVRQEFESILFHLDHIPGYREAGAAARVERERETAIAMHRLVKLIAENPALHQHLESVIAEFNGQPGNPESFNLLHTLLEQQPYRLSYWRTAMQEINYRRFFDINDLIGLRMEHEPLFRAAHAKLIELAEKGSIDGVRLDHIDGLLDPQQYLNHLRSATSQVKPSLYVIVEKILARQEWLSAEWPVEGATGYEFLALLNGLWVEEQHLPKIESIYRDFCGKMKPERDAVYTAKRLITATSMASELNVLAHELNRLSEQNRRSRDFTLDGLQEALREVVACFPVYRTYISERGFGPSDEMAINEAIGQAKRRNPTLESSIFEFIRIHICPVRQPGEASDAFAQRLRFAMKFQQYTSPVQAKGMEDTVFYRYSPLASLNEVGSAAGRRATTPQEFHDANMHRMERWPDAMLATSTHDTKHGEDARMRIHVLTEIPEEWKSKLTEWSVTNEAAKTDVNGHPSPDRADEYLYYQNLLGMWPPRQTAVDGDIVSRMKAFMNKALKEAKLHTSWINPSNDYDAAAEKFVEETLRGSCSAGFLASFIPFAERIAALGAWGSVSQIAVKLMSPGVVDTYQGGELWDLSLVDPDNRRPVDYATRQKRLHALTGSFSSGADVQQRAETIARLRCEWWTGDLKLLYVAQGLRLRSAEPELLSRGSYRPLQATGAMAEHIVAFAREHKGKMLVTIAARWFSSLLSSPGSLVDIDEKLRDTFVEVPGAANGMKFTNLLTGASTSVEDNNRVARVRVSDAVKGLPAAWLMSTDPGLPN